MRKISIALAVLLVTVPLSAAAQSFNPVIEENSVDGLLLGAEGSFRFFGWLEPSLGVAYGLQSQKIRYKAGISFGSITLAMLDWPRTAVLGRIGEAGLKATFKLPWGLPMISGFFGTLWPWTEDPNPPDIAYVTWGSSRSVHLPFGIELMFSHQALQGWWQLGVSPGEFRYSQSRLSLRRELFSLSVSYGTLENKSKFPGFIFSQSVKGESAPLKGEQFWTVQFERAFDVIAIPMPIPLLPIELLVQGAVFSQVASAAKTELPCCGDKDQGKLVWQNQLSWGVSVLISLGKIGVKARIDFVFTRDGKFHFLWSF